MLGVWSSPDGSDNMHLNQVVVAKVSKWVNKIKNAHLPVHLVWKAYRHQLWPGVRYGLATLANKKIWWTASCTNLSSICYRSSG
jgi:hypothetical protein